MTKNKFPHFIVYLGFLTTAISVPKGVFFIHRFHYVIIVAALAYFTVLKKLTINKQIAIICLMVLLFSLVSVLEENAAIYLVFRTFFGLLAMNMALFSYFKYYNYDYQRIIRHYIIIALAASCVGIAQELFYLIGFVPGYDFSWFLIALRTQVIADMSRGGPMMRISSFFSEPGYLAAALAPAGYLAINNLVTGNKAYLKKRGSIVILIALILTFSGLGYVGMILSLLFNFNRRVLRKAFIPFVLLIILIFTITTNVSYFQSRASGLWSSFIEGKITGYENASVLILYLNYKIAKDNFVKHPLIGSGLDSYKIVSQNSLRTMFMNEGLERFIQYMKPEDLHYDDGATMYFKVITELGIFGVCALLWFLYTNNVKGKGADYKLLQNMCLVFFLIYSLRTGQYIRFELWYFLGFYYCIKKYYYMNKHKLAYVLESKSPRF